MGGSGAFAPSYPPCPSLPGLGATVACLSLNYLYFRVEAARRGKEGKGGHVQPFFLPDVAPPIPGWVRSLPAPQVQTLVLRSQGGSRGLARLGGGTVVGQTAAARAKFSL